MQWRGVVLEPSPSFFGQRSQRAWFEMTIKESVKKHRSDLGALLILILMILWFAGGMVWDNQVPFFRDLGLYFYPIRFSLAEAFRAGELPLWERHIAMGFPLLADFQSGVFYPPHLLFLFLPFFDAVRVVFVFHYLIAVTGSYFLCRRWNYPPYQAIIGALLFTLGGTMVSLTNLLNHFQSAVWLPWGVLLWEKFLDECCWRNFIILTLVLLLQLLGGSPEIYVMSALLLMLDGLTVQKAKGHVRFTRMVCQLSAVNLLVAGLAMAQLLPTIELFLESRRQEPMPYAEAASWSLHPMALLNLIFLDKTVEMGMSRGAQLFFSSDIPFFISYYFGAIFLFGFGLWLCYSSTKERIILGGLIGISLLLAFGAFTPVYPFLFEQVPVFRAFRYPEKLFFMTQAFLLFAALKGLFRFLKPDHNPSKRGWVLLSVLFGLLFVVYLLLRFSPELLFHFIVQSKTVPLPFYLTLDNAAAALVSLERQLALMVGLMVLFLVGKSGHLRSSMFQVLLTALVFIDLNWAHQGQQYLLNPAPVLHGPKVLAAPDQDPKRLFFHPHGANLHPSYFSIHRPPSTPYREIHSIIFGNFLPNSGVFFGFEYMQDVNALAKEAYTTFLRFINQIEPVRRFRLLGALNVKYVVSFRELDASGITLVQHFPEYPSWLYTIDRVAPRAYIVQQTREEETPAKVLEYLASEQFDPNLEVTLDKRVPITPNGNFESAAKISEYANQRVVVNTSSNGSGILVLTDSFFPGWRVYVDGREEQILRANYFFRGVALTQGEHSVEFRYEPYWFKVGAIGSILTLVSVGAVSLGLFYRRRRKAASDLANAQERTPSYVY